MNIHVYNLDQHTSSWNLHPYREKKKTNKKTPQNYEENGL